ncbi:MAG: phosphatidate cytidylyltransferase [bacterium]
MFIKRLASAIIFALFVIIIVQYGNSWFFFVLVSIFVVLSSIEFTKLAKLTGGSYSSFITVPITWLICLSAFRSSWIDTNLILFITIALLALYEIIRSKPVSALLNISSAIFGIIYIGWLLGRHLILLRQMIDGKQIIFLLLGITWSGDIGAYLIGKQFGKHKAFPIISPKKSWEGFIAGIIFGILSTFILCHSFSLNIGLVHIIIMGVLLTIIGQIGDLTESILKRGASVKDSGNLMPGHGGILDRCDSLIFITPALYYYLRYILHFN